MLEKVGITREGRLRKDVLVEGEYVAVLLYGHLREEWLDRENAAGGAGRNDESKRS